jgi:hypothetical protein
MCVTPHTAQSIVSVDLILVVDPMKVEVVGLVSPVQPTGF